MNAVQRLAAMAGSAVLALAVVPITTATPAAAATCTSWSITESWGKVTYKVCSVVYTSGNKAQNVSGTVTDLKTDGYEPVANFKWRHETGNQSESYQTGTSRSFESDYHLVEGSVIAGLYRKRV